VLLVIVYHGNTGIIPGGYIGVDIFFVLSGFLITSILLREYSKTGHINLAHFYARRFLRIVPALVLLMMVFTLAALMAGIDLDTLFKDIFATALFISNWTRAFDLRFPIYLAHTWSLSIEEQFYLIWPGMLLFLLKRFSLNVILTIVLASALVSMVWRILLFLNGASIHRVYDGFDTRMDTLLLGAGVACFLALPNSRIKLRVSRVALNFTKLGSLLLVYVLVWSDWTDPSMVLGGYSFVGVFAAATILLLSQERPNFVGRYLEWRPLVLVGQISFGLYLWHYTIFRFMRLELDASPATINTAGVALTFAAATASYILLEKPFLNLKVRFASA